MAKILLVEDDNNLREIYGARLAAEGYEIASAQDGEEALAVAVKEKPDLIISDVMMPKVSGFDMLDILRNAPETKNTKIIMMTALSQAEDKDRASKLGADLYLVKSQVTLEDVVASAKKVLEGSSQDSSGASAPAPTPKPDTPAPAAPATLTPTVEPEQQAPPTENNPTPTPPATPINNDLSPPANIAVPTTAPVQPQPTAASPMPASKPITATPTTTQSVSDPVTVTVTAPPTSTPTPTVEPEQQAPPTENNPTATSPTPPSNDKPSQPTSDPVSTTTPAPVSEPPTTQSAVDQPAATPKKIEVVMPENPDEKPSDSSEPTNEVTTPAEPPKPSADIGPNLAQALAEEEQSIQSQIESFEKNTDTTSEDSAKKGPEEETEPKKEPDQENKEESSVKVGSPHEEATNKRVIQPIHDPTKSPDLDVLLAKEQAKEQGAVASPSSTITPTAINSAGSDSATEHPDDFSKISL